MKLSEVEKLAKELMRDNGVNYKFKFDNAVRRFGLCDNDNKVISLSKKLSELNEEENVRDVILHEIAHALVFQLSKYPHGHDRVWKRMCLELGCHPTREYESNVKTPKAKYRYICNNCGHISERFKKCWRTACGRCCKKYNGGKWSGEYLIKLLEDY